MGRLGEDMKNIIKHYQGKSGKVQQSAFELINDMTRLDFLEEQNVKV